MTFGERLKFLREKEKMYQSELADRLGLAPSTISMYERGDRDPDTSTLTKIAEIFNVSTDYLLGRTNIPNTMDEPIDIAASTKNGIDLSEIDDEEDRKTILNIFNTYKNKGKTK